MDMDANYWLKKWETGDTRFHQSEVHPELLKHAGLFKKGTILVPLSGKSRDMLYLASLNHQVLGVELSEIACRAFFEENAIPYSTEGDEAFTIFRSERITLYCGDFFDLPDSIGRTVSGVYDRAALIALPPELRQRYVERMNSLTQRGTNILLLTIEYPTENLVGPPFSVPYAEVSQSYLPFNVTELTSHAPEEFKKHPKFEQVTVIERVYWLTRN